MRAYLGKDSHSATDDMIAAHANVRRLTCSVEGLRQNIYGQFLLSLKTF